MAYLQYNPDSINSTRPDGSAGSLAGAIPVNTPITDSLGSTGDTEPFIDTSLSWGDIVDNPFSPSQVMKDNPGLSMEEYMKIFSENSDEWAEKMMDYYLERESIDRANEYTASREDTAYQRLVADLKAAGLNPAMMYGSSASPQASGSAGVMNLSSGANSRGYSNLQKIKELLLASVLAQWQIQYQSTSNALKGIGIFANLFGSITKLFG